MPSVLQQAIDKYKHHPFTKYVIIIALIIFIWDIEFMFGQIHNPRIMLT
ncbi:hypothetical protein RMONA_03955 [Rickettsia monacensis]|uniref:Uncharacterized protein n=1 Tax=Rickettsia monacensis TaxID=109232 RepID=A0A0B7IZ28_9RICK|nr:hypothetical protein RMONA_03955 [Rickettsia monacensis]